MQFNIARRVLFSCADSRCIIWNTSINHHKRFMNTMESVLSSNSLLADSSTLIRFDNIAKSQQDNRDYRGLKLKNGLKVLLISDPTTDKSAAAMTVDVGFMSDPDNIPGLAHFCEHMLFLGTEKYPCENDYSVYLAENGGSSNATTYGDNTKYYFDVASDKFDGALDRFAQFFVAPLFTESATEREINAVNSEHEKNLAIDAWRIRQVNKTFSDQNHPYSKFGTGNKKTLLETPKELGLNTRDELIKFHDKWYSANIMCLAVFGKEPLNELEDTVVAKFSGIDNKDVKSPVWNDSPLLAEHYGSKISVVPIKDSRTLTLSFTTPDFDQYYKSGPEYYLSHLIGHEGKGSILSELKSKGWCNNLMAGHNNAARGFGFFEIMVDLTKEGFSNIDDIIKIIFQYLQLLNSKPPHKWVFDENRKINDMIFRFKDKENPLSLVTSVVQSIQVYPFEEVLTAPYLISDWRPDLIEDIVKTFTPDRIHVVIVGQQVAPIADKTEFWYSTKYNTEKIPEHIIALWQNCGLNDKLHIPTPNPFIPTEFELCPFDTEIQPYPTIILDSPTIRVWFKQDKEFLKPKTIMNFDFSSPIVYSDPLNCNLTHMFVQLFEDHLNEYVYEAEMAGLKFNVTNTSYGVSISISGYSHKQQVLLRKVLDQMFAFEIDPKRFEILKELYIRSLENFKTEQPYQHAVYYLALILTENAWSKQELVDACALLSVERLQRFIAEFLSRLHVECLIHGNANQRQAIEIAALVENKICTTNSVALPLLSRQLLLKRELKLQTCENYLFEQNNLYHKSSCSEIYLQCGLQDNHSNVFVDLVSQILREPCYNILRTQEQLGYIVFLGTRKACGVQGIRIFVQSDRHPEFVEERIELFLEGMTNQLEIMSDEEFGRHKEALITQKLEKPKRLNQLFNKFLHEISLQQYHFDRVNVEVALLRTVTKKQLIDYYKEHIVRGAPSRQALSVHIVSKLDNEAPTKISLDDNSDSQKLTNMSRVLIQDLAVFKSSKELYPMVQPYINIQPKGGKSKL